MYWELRDCLLKNYIAADVEAHAKEEKKNKK